MEYIEELADIAQKLNEFLSLNRSCLAPLEKLEDACAAVGKTHSGSWLGYQAKVYYKGFKLPAGGANFSLEWGLMRRISNTSDDGWKQYDDDEVKEYIHRKAGECGLASALKKAKEAEAIFLDSKGEIHSVLELELKANSDPFLEKLKEDLENLKPVSAQKLINQWCPKGQLISRDMVAIGQGYLTPPHLDILADTMALRHSFDICGEAATICAKVSSHLRRKAKLKRSADRIGTNVFIGHGRSESWRELKDFVQERLHLPWDEFNRVPVAGLTNIARLSEMLDAAAIGFLILTAEDELADGSLQARMNVIHEAGLFQGRLGFTKAILLLEDGCSEFSNIQGLGQIRFPKGKISAAFEEIRRVLEREALLASNETSEATARIR